MECINSMDSIIHCQYSLTRCLRRISTRNNYFVITMCNINTILTRTKTNRDYFMPLTVLNESPVVRYAPNVLRRYILKENFLPSFTTSLISCSKVRCANVSPVTCVSGSSSTGVSTASCSTLCSTS